MTSTANTESARHPEEPRGDLWRPAGSEPSHPLAALDAAEVGQGVGLSVELGPLNRAGARHFRAFLEADELGRTLAPVFEGLHHTGPYPAHNWVEVTHFRGHAPVAAGDVEVPEGIDVQIVERLAALVPPGGHLMMEYESDHRRVTARALAQRVPPVATPLGGMMFAAGCGVAFRDWYLAEGGREGPRKLQGHRAVDVAHEASRYPSMLADLERFLETSADLDWDLQVKCRPLAEATITVLRSRGLG